MVARLFGLDRRRRRGAPPATCSTGSASTDAGDRLVRTYSGGMRRRLDLGASLVGRPAPAAARRADHRARSAQPHRAVGRRSASLVADGTDVLLTTQYLEEADQLARDVVIIDHGRVDRRRARPTSSSRRAGRDVIEVRPRRAADLGAVADVLAGRRRRAAAHRRRHPPRRRAGRRRRRPAGRRRPPARRARHHRRRHRAAPPDARRGVPRPHRPARPTTDRPRRSADAA